MAKLKKEKRTEKALLDVIIFAIQEKKGEDISVIDLKKIPSAVSDFFVLATATNETQLEAIKESIEKETYIALKEDPISTEGSKTDGWIIIDFFNIVIHIFLAEKREKYALEELWGDANIKHIKQEK